MRIVYGFWRYRSVALDAVRLALRAARDGAIAFDHARPAGMTPIIDARYPARLKGFTDAVSLRLSRGDWYAVYQVATGEYPS